MIISVSRRTDIPAFYADWFFNRLRAGFALVRNPVNPRQITRVDLAPEAVDCLVFWTKNPAPLLPKLHHLANYAFYIQFTLNPYGPDLEAALPEKSELAATFRRLSETIGRERLVWRYSPVLINEKYTADFHLKAFERLADNLGKYAERCHLSFLDIYDKVKKPLAAMGITDPPLDEKRRLAQAFFKTARERDLALDLCGAPGPEALGLEPAACIDRRLIERLTGRTLKLKKDPGQRPECLCAQSVDLGAYDTCAHSCLYCYANRSSASARRRFEGHAPDSPLLFGILGPEDVISTRTVKSRRNGDNRLF